MSCCVYETNKSDIIGQMICDEFDLRHEHIMKFHTTHLPLMRKAKGSEAKHQAWEGGYYDHILDCLCLAESLWKNLDSRPPGCDLRSALTVLYFHDIEKMWKYTEGLPENWNKEKYLTESLPRWGFSLTPEEIHAIHYIHGEGDDYCKKRVMSELAGFCHAIDVLSARVWHSQRYNKDEG